MCALLIPVRAVMIWNLMWMSGTYLLLFVISYYQRWVSILCSDRD